MDNILTELIFETVDNSDPSESTSSPGVSDESKIKKDRSKSNVELNDQTSFLQIFSIFFFVRSTPLGLSAFLVQAVTPSTLDADISKEEKARREMKQMYMQKPIFYFLTASSL